MYQISTQTSTTVGLFQQANLINSSGVLQLPLEAALPTPMALSQPRQMMDSVLDRSFEQQQASLRSAHALGFWIVGVILLAISASTGLLVCRSPRGTGRRVTADGTVTRTRSWKNSSQQPPILPLCSSAVGICTKDGELCAGCKHLREIKYGIPAATLKRSQSLSTISYEVDDAPPPYSSLEELRVPIEALNPVLQTVIQVQGPPHLPDPEAQLYRNAHC